MSDLTRSPRTDAELLAISAALSRTRGAAPVWLARELAVAPDPFTTPSPSARRSQRAAAASLACLLGAFALCARFDAEAAPSPKTAYRAPTIDWDGKDAVALAQAWRIAGDDETVLARLGGIRRHADGPAWTAERTGDDSYLVIYREPEGFPAYAFEVDLETEEVRATPEAVDALTLLRVRGESEQRQMVARAN